MVNLNVVERTNILLSLNLNKRHRRNIKTLLRQQMYFPFEATMFGEQWHNA